MTNSTNNKNVPELRFPEFEGEWTEIKLNQFIISSAFGPRFSSSFYHPEGNIATLRTTDMDNEGNINLKNLPLAKLEIQDFKEHILEPNDVVISRSGTIGITSVFKGYKLPTLPGAFLIRFRFHTNGLNPEYIKSYFNGEKGRNKLVSLSAGGVQKNLTSTSVLNLKLKLPTFPEQTKIATFLTAVDKRIHLLTQKKEKLEHYKKGVMQKLFSRELRFKPALSEVEGDENGNDYPEWEEKRLGEIFEIIGGGTPDTTKKEYWNGNIHWFTPTEIKNKYIIGSQRSISELGLKKSSAKLLAKGTLLFTSRATIGDVGIAVNECCTNQGFQSFIPNNENDIEFLYYWIKCNKKKFIRRSSGSTFLEISKSEIQKVRIKIPSLPEQQKIASFLSAIDKQIEQVARQIEHSNQWKKGLLQKMFV